MTNTPTGQDDSTQQPAASQGGDALAQLEVLLQKTRAAKGQGLPGQASQGPTAEDMQAQAEALAKAEVEKQAAFEAQMAQAEVERQRALVEQQQKMAELAQTPQYQARIEQTKHEEEKKNEEQAVHDGHEILQITTKKL